VANTQTSNIPTELLRTFIAVVDLRSFTKAAQALGVTQPAVSAQIKRLQFLLGIELFDKSAPGVTLTEKGDLVVTYARRILALNDQILSAVMPGDITPPLRVGIPGDFAGSILPRTVAEFQARTPDLRVQLRGDPSESLLRELGQGLLDLAVALTTSPPAVEPRYSWREEVVWIRGAGIEWNPAAPVRLVTLRENSIMYRVATSTLKQAGRDFQIVFSAFATNGLTAAVAAGLGIAVLPRSQVPSEVEIWHDAPLPKPSDAYCGIYLREGADCPMLEQLADCLFADMQASGSGPSRPEAAPAPQADDNSARRRSAGGRS
jgi:DNA-binding transcriptional LysR family regulator